MAEDATVHSESFKIRASEVNTNGRATLPAICSLFQEVAGNHALKLNFDISQLHEQNLTWVLHRMDIKMDRFPDWRETITIETWPAAGDALRAYRDYRVLDKSGTQIGCCLSYWMMINLETRRPIRIPEQVLEFRSSENEHVLPVKSNRLKPFEETDEEIKITVRKSDLDMNRHVNNARYVEWMLELYDEEGVSQINEMDIMFLKESRFGEKLNSMKKLQNEQTSYHQLINNHESPVALAKISKKLTNRQ